MPKPITVPMTPNITVGDNYIVRFTAISPVTGATVSGVTVSGCAILGNDVADSADDGVPTPDAVKNTAVFLPGPA